jgi:alkylhydroperoxidase/carboxymuconolactone decarboxylase family protein YurZ
MGMSATILMVLVFACVTVFVSLAYRYHVREMEHKQMLAAIEKGVDPPVPQSAPWTPRTYLLHGMIWLFAGLASFIALSAIAATSRRPIPVEVTVRAATEARERGATPEEIQMLLHTPREEEGIPMGLGFLGLIPVGVGLAYLIFYRVESRKLLS